MHTLSALLVAAAAACAIARPPGPTAKEEQTQLLHNIPLQRPYVDDYVVPRMRDPALAYGYNDGSRALVPAESFQHGWLDKEIDRLNRMDDDDDPLTDIEMEFYRLMSESPYKGFTYEKIRVPGDTNGYSQKLPRVKIEVEPRSEPQEKKPAPGTDKERKELQLLKEDKKDFAYTPLDEKFFEPEDKMVVPNAGGHHEGGDEVFDQFQSRTIRQNPISRTKNLIAANLDRLRIGITPEVPDATHKPGPLLSTSETADNIFSVALVAGILAAVIMTVFALSISWYTLSKKAKAAADVDYPAYGVTGPTMDMSGDRKLAHSAHMYHYQHQKQQIIAMERGGLERNGSVSDPESEEENEEGDYTVYECPGFATTGEMEVRNPLFSDDPTPATPGKCELVKPQPKD